MLTVLIQKKKIPLQLLPHNSSTGLDESGCCNTANKLYFRLAVHSEVGSVKDGLLLVKSANSCFQVNGTRRGKSTPLASQSTDRNVTILNIGVTGPLDRIYDEHVRAGVFLLNSSFEVIDTV